MAPAHAPAAGSSPWRDKIVSVVARRLRPYGAPRVIVGGFVVLLHVALLLLVAFSPGGRLTLPEAVVVTRVELRSAFAADTTDPPPRIPDPVLLAPRVTLHLPASLDAHLGRIAESAGPAEIAVAVDSPRTVADRVALAVTDAAAEDLRRTQAACHPDPSASGTFLVHVAVDGRVLDVRPESGTANAAVDTRLAACVAALSTFVPRRIGDAAVASWQRIRWAARRE